VSYGLLVNDEGGNPIVNVADRLGRIIGSVSVGTTNGSIVVPEFSMGIGFYFLRANGPQQGTFPPTITIVGNVLSWSQPSGYNSAWDKTPGTIFYGIY
jgi:hypothetical protein